MKPVMPEAPRQPGPVLYRLRPLPSAFSALPPRGRRRSTAVASPFYMTGRVAIGSAGASAILAAHTAGRPRRMCNPDAYASATTVLPAADVLFANCAERVSPSISYVPRLFHQRPASEIAPVATAGSSHWPSAAAGAADAGDLPGDARGVVDRIGPPGDPDLVVFAVHQAREGPRGRDRGRAFDRNMGAVGAQQAVSRFRSPHLTPISAGGKCQRKIRQSGTAWRNFLTPPSVTRKPMSSKHLSRGNRCR